MSHSMTLPPASVPQTILHQLGGRLFCRVTGAKDLVHGDKTLMMSVSPRMTKSRINRVRITLCPSDTYRIETFHYSGRLLALTRIGKLDDVYAENLQRSFVSLTGLVCTPPNVILFPEAMYGS